jgi:hypothetical protein
VTAVVSGALPRELSPLQKARLAAEIVLALVQVRRLLRRGTLPEALFVIRADASGAVASPPRDVLIGMRLGRAVRRTLRLLPADTRCLSQSLVLTRLLARRRIPSVLVLGVRPSGRFAAHAWVECCGEPVLPTLAEAFEPLARL